MWREILETCLVSVVISLPVSYLTTKLLILFIDSKEPGDIYGRIKSSKKWLAQQEKERKEDEALHRELEANPGKRKRVLAILKSMEEAGYFHENSI